MESAMRQLEWQRVVVGCGLGALGVMLFASCSVDLGKCDMTMLGGSDMAGAVNTGQIVVNSHCAGGRCHSEIATGAQRVGAPAGLNFDAVVSDNLMTTLTRTMHGLRNIKDKAQNIWAAVDGDAMPPKKEGTPLTAVEKEQLRNWLACGAPPVLAPQSTVITPDWTSIYTGLVSSNCFVCHDMNRADGAAMGFSLGSQGDACAAYKAVLNQPSVTPMCKGKGLVLVVPGNPAGSFMYQKLTQAMPPCGGSMPFGSAMPLAQINPMVTTALQQWIMANAPPPPNCQ